MSGTREGGLKASKTNRERYGDDWYKTIGCKGGQAKVPKGFALNIERARLAGAKGGKISKRGKAKKHEEKE